MREEEIFDMFLLDVVKKGSFLSALFLGVSLWSNDWILVGMFAVCFATSVVSRIALGSSLAKFQPPSPKD